MKKSSRHILDDRSSNSARPRAARRRASEDNTIILDIHDIHAGYGEIEVLKGVSFAIYEKDLVCVVGSNGAGKSTLLKAIFGQVQVSQGEILFNGKAIANHPPPVLLRQGIAISPQGRNNFPEMTVKENLEMGAYIREDGNVAEDIEWVMEKFPILGHKRNDLAGNLSGGQQQILEMACALLLHPRLLLIDEPSLGLAPIIVSQVFSAIEDINQSGTTIVLVEQNAKQALEISSRAIVLDLGIVRMDGTAKEIRENPTVKRLFLGE